jgi:hypothetical protein
MDTALIDLIKTEKLIDILTKYKSMEKEIVKLNQEKINTLQQHTNNIKLKDNEIEKLKVKVLNINTSMNTMLEQKNTYIATMEKQIMNKLNEEQLPLKMEVLEIKKSKILLPEQPSKSEQNVSGNQEPEDQEDQEEEEQDDQEELEEQEEQEDQEEQPVETNKELDKQDQLQKNKSKKKEINEITNDDINGYELILYKKTHYLRNLETDEIYDIVNKKPHHKIGIMSNGKIKINTK